MFASRRSSSVDLGLPSTAEYMTSPLPASTKQQGTTCGRPSDVTVARRATRASCTRRRIAASSTADLARPGVEVEQQRCIPGLHVVLPALERDVHIGVVEPQGGMQVDVLAPDREGLR